MLTQQTSVAESPRPAFACRLPLTEVWRCCSTAYCVHLMAIGVESDAQPAKKTVSCLSETVTNIIQAVDETLRESKEFEGRVRHLVAHAEGSVRDKPIDLSPNAGSASVNEAGNTNSVAMDKELKVKVLDE